jgi:hypothetical protein
VNGVPLTAAAGGAATTGKSKPARAVAATTTRQTARRHLRRGSRATGKTRDLTLASVFRAM